MTPAARDSLFPLTAAATAEDCWGAYQFLLPSPTEVAGILGEGWVESESLKAKTTLLRLLGWDAQAPPLPRRQP